MKTFMSILMVPLMKRAFGAAVVAAMVGVASIALAGAAADTQVLTIPIVDGSFFNSCGEDMVLNGAVRLVIHTTVDANGGSALVIRQSQTLKGVGVVSGKTYQVIQTSGSMQTQAVSGPMEFTQTFRFRVIGAGPNNNVMGDGVAHVTVGGDGEVTVAFGRFSAECNK